MPSPVLNPRHPVLAVSISVWRGDRVLLIRRGKDPGRGLWSPVGGRVEFGEATEAAAIREVAEEACIDCRISGLSDFRDMIFRDPTGTVIRHIVLAVFAATWISGEARAGDDADAVAWARSDELGTYQLVEGVLPYILATRRLIGGV